jgi:NADH-quinone oxidoreductase subunit G
VKSIRKAAGTELDALEELRDALAAEPELVILFNDSVKGDAVRKLVAFGQSLGIR